MQSIACTLFEKSYHYGVGALVNSLYQAGFRGNIYAGYVGQLPPWATRATSNYEQPWKNCKSLRVAENLTLHFLPLETDYHLTNYKPDFMLQLWASLGQDAKSIFYFDPDIVVTRPWKMFEEWINSGVALCEDINSPLPQHHPRREAWRNFFMRFNLQLAFKEGIYANGGFIGIHQRHKDFLKLWKNIQEKMGTEIGGLNRSMFTNKQELETAGGAFFPFAKTDQDALNATIEAYQDNVSFVCKDGMGFEKGVQLMHHALGTPKPWDWQPITRALAGFPPRPVDRIYWEAISRGPLNVTSRSKIQRRMLAINLAMALGRFYHRN